MNDSALLRKILLLDTVNLFEMKKNKTKRENKSSITWERS